MKSFLCRIRIVLLFIILFATIGYGLYMFVTKLPLVAGILLVLCIFASILIIILYILFGIIGIIPGKNFLPSWMQ